MRLSLRKQAFAHRAPRKKMCRHFEDVAVAAEAVVSGHLPPSDIGTKTLAEEYLMLHLEFKALMTHLEGR